MPYTQRPDENLAQLIAGGDERAFKELYVRCLPGMLTTGRQLLKSELFVSEVIQETLIRLWTSRSKLAVIRTPRAWVFRIFSNECFRILKKNGLQQIPLNVHLAEVIADHDADVENSLMLREVGTAIDRSITTLSARQREIYTLRREEGLKIREIAGRLGLSTKYVKKTLAVALHHIRRDLERFARTFLFSFLFLILL